MTASIFLTSSGNTVIQDVVEKLGRDPASLRTAFITTASETEGPDLEWLNKDREGVSQAGFDLFDYTVTDKNSEQVAEDLKGVSVIYVAGGNTFYLLLQFRKCGFAHFIRKFMDNGGIYIGSSAGSIVTAPNITIAKRIEKKDYEEELVTFEGFSLVDFIVLPHWGSDYFREIYLSERIENAYTEGNKIILLTDTQYVMVDGDKYKIIDVGDESS